MKKLYTIGYEGAELADFLATLTQVKTNILLDVREFPMSRRRGYSKTALKNALADVNIDYRHEKLLGSPKAVRHQLRVDWDYERFFREFNLHLKQQTSLLDSLAEDLEGNVALMCYERDHTTCHRHSVVNELARRLDLEPVHLHVENNNERREARQSSYPYFGKGLSPA